MVPPPLLLVESKLQRPTPSQFVKLFWENLCRATTPFGRHCPLPRSAVAAPAPPAPITCPESVSHNPIKGWTLDVSGLRKMRHLRLKGVGLDRCPVGIDRLNKLETLDLSDNRIDALEQSSASLFKLKVLDLSSNNIPVRTSSNLYKRIFHGRREEAPRRRGGTLFIFLIFRNPSNLRFRAVLSD